MTSTRERTDERDHIIQAAAELLARDVTATMADVAKAAAVSAETLNRHFPSRGELVWALGKLGTDKMEASLEAAKVEEGPAEEAVRRLLDEALPFAAFLAFLYGENQLHGPGELDDAWVRIGERARGLFARGQREGVFRQDLSPAWVSESLWALIAVSSWTIQDGHMKPEEAFDSVFGLLLDGARKR